MVPGRENNALHFFLSGYSECNAQCIFVKIIRGFFMVIVNFGGWILQVFVFRWHRRLISKSFALLVVGISNRYTRENEANICLRQPSCCFLALPPWLDFFWLAQACCTFSPALLSAPCSLWAACFFYWSGCWFRALGCWVLLVAWSP